MRIIKFQARYADTCEPTGKDLATSLGDELERRINSASNEDEKISIYEEYISFVLNLLTFVKKDAEFVKILNDKGKTQQYDSLMEKICPEDGISEKSLIDSLVMENPKVPDSVRLKFQLRLLEEEK